MTLNKNTYPYFDDFSESKKYYQILFRPGVAVQSRELSQMQSIVQKQIDYFGKSIFKEGAMVIPGEIAVDFNYAYVTIEDTYDSSEVSVDDFLDKKIVGTTSGAVATVVAVEDSTSTDSKTLFLKYNVGDSSTSFTGNITNNSAVITNLSVSATNVLVEGMILTGVGIPSNSYIVSIDSATQITLNNQCTATTTGLSIVAQAASVFEDGEDIVTLEDVPVYATTESSSSTGIGTAANIGQGVYFINGYFCLVEAQSLILEKYTTDVNCKVGLSYRDSFITESDDVSLNDPASGSTNYNAPGAHRYYIDVVLTSIGLDDAVPTNFIELVRIKDGQIQSIVNKTQYSELEKTFARRTYDESGNYTVRSFPLQVREHLNDGTNNGVYTLANGGDATKLVYALDSGKAYVKGYEIELQSTKFLEVDKPRDFNTVQNYTISSTQGNYVICDNLTGSFDISSYESLTLKDVGDATIGSAKISGFSLLSGSPGNSATTYKLFLFDISMNTGKLFSEITSIEGDTNGATATPVLEDSIAVLYYPYTINTILSTSEYALKTINDITYTARRYHSGAMSGSTITLTANTGETFLSNTVLHYHVSILSVSATGISHGYGDGDIIDMTDVSNTVTLGGSPVGKQVTLTIPDIAGSTIAVIASIIKTSPTVKTKTLTSRTQSGLSHSSTVMLDKADIYDIVSITDDTTAEDITDKYQLDDGQRDAYYDLGRLVFNSKFSAPAGTISVSYRYFAHGVGDLFTVDSYDSAIDYSDVPIYTSNISGTMFDLINCIDFRPRIDDSGTGFSVYSEPVADSETITFDYDYYLGRIDKIVLDSSGNFSVVSGVSDINPLPPKDPVNSMILYQVSLPPYTFNSSDSVSTIVDNRRYTMRDIGKLDARIGNLEYYTALSLLEKSTADMFIDDGTGSNRFKNGFVVDNFKSHLVGNSLLKSYQCSVDSDNGILRPPFVKTAVDMNLDATNSSNYQQTGTLITLPYTSVKYISQPFASKTVNVNPYAIYNWLGKVVLTPSSDTWYETTRLPDYVIYSEEDISNEQAALIGSTIWGEWETDWAGSSVSKTQIKAKNSSSGTALTNLLKTPTQSQPWNGQWAASARSSAAKQGIDLTLLTNTSTSDANHNISGTATYLVATTTEQTRTGITYSLSSSVTNDVIDDKVLASTTIPYMREKEVYFTANGLKPNTQVYPIFDNIDVTDYCKPDTSGSSFGDDLLTDNSGSISGYFDIPCTDSVKFTTGEKTFKLVDNVDDVYNSSTSASAIYSAKGVLQTKQATILSTKRYELAENEITESQSTTITTTEQQKVKITWSDPLAQTFLVDNPEGAFVSKIDVYLASKDSAGIPLRIQIRNTVNGYPGQYIVPMSDVFVNPDDITVSDDGSEATTFTFPSPIYLEGNQEYCFVLMSNSNSYNVWVSELGGYDVSSGSLISEQPYAGVMFKSQNASTWTASQEEDIKFDIYRCSFNTGVTGIVTLENDDAPLTTLPANPFTTTEDTNGILPTILVNHPSHGFVNGNTVTFSGVTGTQNGISASALNDSFVVSNVTFDTYEITLDSNGGIPTAVGACGGVRVQATSNTTIDSMYFNAQTLTYSNASLDWAFKGLDDTFVLDTYRNISSNDTIDLDLPRYILNPTDQSDVSVNIKGTLQSSTTWLSPVIDTERLSLICVSNRINDDSTNETDSNSGNSLARYITKKVTLATSANAIKVYFSAVRPSGSDIKVYIKYLPDGDNTDFNDLDYVELTAVTYPNVDSVNLGDYEFGIDGLDEYSMFSIKIVMLGEVTTEIPQIKEFRAIALAT